MAEKARVERLKDKFLSCVSGLAIGDALGAPVEFMRIRQIRDKYGPEGVSDFQSSGTLPAGITRTIRRCLSRLRTRFTVSSVYPPIIAKRL